MVVGAAEEKERTSDQYADFFLNGKFHSCALKQGKTDWLMLWGKKILKIDIN